MNRIYVYKNLRIIILTLWFALVIMIYACIQNVVLIKIITDRLYLHETYVLILNDVDKIWQIERLYEYV